MKRAFVFPIPGVMVFAFLALASTPASAEWKKGNNSEIRIKLSHPDLKGNYRYRVMVDDHGGGKVTAQSDSIRFGEINGESDKYLYATYQTGQFRYERLSEWPQSVFETSKYNIEETSVDGECKTEFTDVEYFVKKITNKENGNELYCGFWGALYNGNSSIYRGYYCVKNRELTDADVKKAANSVTKIKK